ncbi:MAG: acetate--CoA ligase [Deltaproteobacteria bacterium]|nr:acetate--CoA ligase [Deltaproteobacteria bacterium]
MRTVEDGWRAGGRQNLQEKTTEKKDIIEVLSAEKRVFPPPPEFSEKAHIKSMEDYAALYRESVENPNGFWEKMASVLTWSRRWDRVSEWDFNKPFIKWYVNGKLNASFNCLDRHLKTPVGDRAAIIWEADNGETRTFTYRELHRQVSRFSNVLKKKGVKKGDRVTIYLPMIPELPVSMLACARIGAIHNVVFGGFSAASLEGRILDCAPGVLITADSAVRGGKSVPLKANADSALNNSPSVKDVIVVKRAGADVDMKKGRDAWWHEEISAADIKDDCAAEEMDSEDPLFILYTSGSTGRPKGVLHTTGGYLVFSALTFKWVFDWRDRDIFFCTADIGWVTGHSYIVYGPLAVGATTVMFEGRPTYPGPDRFWEIVEKYRVSIIYTAPTAIRALMRYGDEWVKRRDLKSLRLLGTVGEPINPEAWMWYHEVVGNGRLPIVDTWWQTETGGILITPLPGAIPLKPGSATRPFFGIVPEVLTEEGRPAKINEGGCLVIKKPWPGIMRGTYGDPENRHMKEIYFSRFPGYYFTGDAARVDKDGDYWLMGRMDDVLNVSGHRLGTAEVESALVAHRAVAEAACVGFPHEIKGDGIYAYVVLKEGFGPSEKLREELTEHVRKEISPIAKPDKLQFATGLPKTRSGKIMRRILRKIAAGLEGGIEELGDISTLADPAVVEGLIRERL